MKATKIVFQGANSNDKYVSLANVYGLLIQVPKRIIGPIFIILKLNTVLLAEVTKLQLVYVMGKINFKSIFLKLIYYLLVIWFEIKCSWNLVYFEICNDSTAFTWWNWLLNIFHFFFFHISTLPSEPKLFLFLLIHTQLRILLSKFSIFIY